MHKSHQVCNTLVHATERSKSSIITSYIESWRPVVGHRLLHAGPPVLLGDGYEHHAHHEHHEADGEEGGSQDVGDFPTVSCEVQTADDHAAEEEAPSGGHEMDGQPEHLGAAVWGGSGGVLGGVPERVGPGEAEHGGFCAGQGGRQLLLGLGERALTQRDVLRPGHGLLWG